MLEVENLSVSYGAHRALEKVSVKVGANEICVILGANGAGKSSLLKAIAGLVPASPGTRIAIGGRDVTGEKPHRIVEAGLALVPEGRGIFGDLSVAENLQLGSYGKQARTGETKRLEQVLALFPRLGERRGQTVRTMSGGEQQMVAIGRALMSNPEILMLDEPSLGLSPILTKDLFRSLAAVRDTGVGILLVEQNAKQSLAIADRGYLIENGHITGEGTGRDLAGDPAVQSAYLGGAVSRDVREDGLRGKDHPVRMPVAIQLPSEETPEAMAERAARIQSEFVRSQRTGARGAGATNGHAHRHANTFEGNGDAIVVNRQAHELSQQAADFANRAARIQREHVESQRIGSHLAAASNWAAKVPAPARNTDAPASSASEIGRRAGEFAARAAEIQRQFVLAMRSEETEPGDEKRKLTKKAKKAAKKARKLAEKAMRADH